MHILMSNDLRYIHIKHSKFNDDKIYLYLLSKIEKKSKLKKLLSKIVMLIILKKSCKEKK